MAGTESFGPGHDGNRRRQTLALERIADALEKIAFPDEFAGGPIVGKPGVQSRPTVWDLPRSNRSRRKWWHSV